VNFPLNHDTRVQVPITNERVFGHGGNPEQVHNEVYEWLDTFAGPVPGIGSRWCYRKYYAGFASEGFASLAHKIAKNRAYGRLGIQRSSAIAGKFFYFADPKTSSRLQACLGRRMKGMTRVTITAPSMETIWQIHEWHMGPKKVDYYPNIDYHQNVAHYDFEDREDAMRFKLAFGGKAVETDN
jgi:hypothetical protein